MKLNLVHYISITVLEKYVHVQIVHFWQIAAFANSFIYINHFRTFGFRFLNALLLVYFTLNLEFFCYQYTIYR